MYFIFIQKENGTIVKAVNYDGEMVIIEEVHLFESSEPIKILHFSNVTVIILKGLTCFSQVSLYSVNLVEV